MGVFMVPRPDDPFDGSGDVLDEVRNRVPIAIVPTAYRKDGGGDGRIILTDRSVFPISVTMLMAMPSAPREVLVFQTMKPHLFPIVADQRRVRGARIVGQHVRGPTEVFQKQTTAFVVDVIGIAVDCRADGNDGFQCGWAERGDLQAVETAPRDSLHPDIAIAPRLRGGPCDDVAGIL